MNFNQEELLCCPECKGELEVRETQSEQGNIKLKLWCKNCMCIFYHNENYVDFMGEKTLPYSGKWEKFIRSFYAKIYTPATNFMFLFCGGVKNAKREVLSQLEIKDNQKVLETGIGAAENFYLLNIEAKNLSFFGIDIQQQMLDHSIKNLKKWNIPAQLYKADAHSLPFKNESFDVVFHLGSINLFPDKKKAIDEMIRVARPGTKIVIADESEKAGKLINMLTGSSESFAPPVDLIPNEMTDIKLENIWKGNGYLIEFRKPPLN